MKKTRAAQKRKFEAIAESMRPKSPLGHFHFSDSEWTAITENLKKAAPAVTDDDLNTRRVIIERAITLWRFISPDRAGRAIDACEKIRRAFTLLGEALDTELGEYLLKHLRTADLFDGDTMRAGFYTNELIGNALESMRTKKAHRNLFILTMITHWEYVGGEAKASVTNGDEGGPLVRFLMQTTRAVGISINNVIARERVREYQKDLKARTNSKTREEAYAFNRAMHAGGEKAGRMCMERFPEQAAKYLEESRLQDGNMGEKVSRP